MTAAIAIGDASRRWSDDELQGEIATLSDVLRKARVRVLATVMDNGVPWVVADLAAARAGVVHVPLPAFFTRRQCEHALKAAGADALLHATRDADAAGAGDVVAPRTLTVAGSVLQLARLAQHPVPLPAGTSKITFTSGSSGTPKGVCLSREAMARVAEGVAHATAPLGIERHLCALPLAVLLENVVGVLATRLRGVTIIVPPLEPLGLVGSSAFDPAAFDRGVRLHRPHSIVLLPGMLRAWAVHLAREGRRAPDSLKLVAVGGATVGASLIEAARCIGIPAYEGYGLTEGASVQTLNLPGADRPGSVGRPLPHARLRVRDDGEIECAGPLHLGYLGTDAPRGGEWWATGDLGCVDPDGFVHLRGRRKNVLITAFGRNVSPEWVEAALKSQDIVAEAVVFGESLASLRAVLWPTADDVSDAALDAAVAAANVTLPDYARIGRWTRGAVRFSDATGVATSNGRPLRDAIEAMHAQALGLGSHERASHRSSIHPTPASST